MNHNQNPRVGDIRPTQLMHTYGVGAIVDLPRISVIVAGLEDWPTQPPEVRPIIEDRLLQAVRYTHPDVTRLLAPPVDRSEGLPVDPFESEARIGVPVAPFPRWMVCPECRLLAPLKSKLFELKPDPYYPERTAYRHVGCNQSRGRKSPEVIPARFMVACEKGHLDDFPWIEFVHRGHICDRPLLRLIERGPSGEARDLEVSCETCGAKRRLAQAFGPTNREKMPDCRGRRPHLRDYDPEGCEYKMRPIILGASNAWFPAVQSSIAIPVSTGRLSQLVQDHWAKLQFVGSPSELGLLRKIGQLGGDLSPFSDADIWLAIEKKKQQDGGDIGQEEPPDLRTPEWEVLVKVDPALNTNDFRLRSVEPPGSFKEMIRQVVLVERLREVQAMIGFSRIDSTGELTDPDIGAMSELAPLSRQAPTWVPANEIRGEGIFIQFDERAVRSWEEKKEVKNRRDEFFNAHKKWREARKIEPIEGGFPGMRYVLIHTFAHALMRQLSLECGYTSASIKERIYAHPGDDHRPPMAGVLIYTATPDSEGTLGGLVSLGETATFERHLFQMLEDAKLCGSDPLCAEHPPSLRGQTLHGAACHSCLFAPETACERGNKYLDRSVLVKTVEIDDLAFFEVT